MPRPHDDQFGVDRLVGWLRPEDDEGNPTNREELIAWMHGNAKRERDTLTSMLEEGVDVTAQALRVGRLWGAADLSRRAVLWDPALAVVPPSPHEPGDRFHPDQLTTEWMVSAGLAWGREQVDALDRELFALATSAHDRTAMVTWCKLRGVLEVATAWRTEAVIADRHVVPVSDGDEAPVVLHKAPPCRAFLSGGALRAKLEAMLDEAMNEGLLAATGGGTAVDRLRAADMATGRAQAYRLVLSLLPAEPVDDDHEGLGETCEGCTNEAVTRDSMGVPLCGPCYDDLPLLGDEPGDDTDTDGGFTPYRAEDGHAP